MTKTQVPAIEGWFTTDPERPALLGTRCTGCGTYAFPRASAFCANPACPSTTFDEVELSRTGTVWSFTNSCYEPPPPYISPTGEFEPYTLAAVELATEGIVVLGQLAGDTTVDDLAAGTPVELVIDTLYEDDEHEYLVWKWKVAD